MNTKSTLTPQQAAITSQKLMEAAIVSRVWSDENFLAKLEANPAEALAEAGIPAPQGKTIRVIREEPKTIHITLPPKPAATAEASDDELAAVAGGALIDNGKCAVWDGISKSRKDGKIGDLEEFFFKGCTVVSGAIGVSWGWM